MVAGYQPDGSALKAFATLQSRFQNRNLRAALKVPLIILLFEGLVF